MYLPHKVPRLHAPILHISSCCRRGSPSYKHLDTSYCSLQERESSVANLSWCRLEGWINIITLVLLSLLDVYIKLVKVNHYCSFFISLCSYILIIIIILYTKIEGGGCPSNWGKRLRRGKANENEGRRNII